MERSIKKYSPPKGKIINPSLVGKSKRVKIIFSKLHIIINSQLLGGKKYKENFITKKKELKTGFCQKESNFTKSSEKEHCEA